MTSHLRNEKRVKQLAYLGFLKRSWTKSSAARQAGVTMTQVFNWRDDPDFAAEEIAAYDEGTDDYEEIAAKRAFHGVLKPVYQQGHRVGTIREYSDTLAVTILKRRNPAFRERHEVTGKDGAPIKFILASDKERDV
jgi:hypothetical protein